MIRASIPSNEQSTNQEFYCFTPSSYYKHLGIATDLSLLAFLASQITNDFAIRIVRLVASLESAGNLVGIGIMYPIYQWSVGYTLLAEWDPLIYLCCGSFSKVPFSTVCQTCVNRSGYRRYGCFVYLGIEAQSCHIELKNTGCHYTNNWALLNAEIKMMKITPGNIYIT